MYQHKTTKTWYKRPARVSTQIQKCPKRKYKMILKMKSKRKKKENLIVDDVRDSTDEENQLKKYQNELRDITAAKNIVQKVFTE